MTDLRKLQTAVADCRRREQAIIREIIALGESAPEREPAPPQPKGLSAEESAALHAKRRAELRANPTEHDLKVKALDDERKAVIAKRKSLEPALAALLGQVMAVAKMQRKQGKVVQAAIQSALASLDAGKAE